MIDTQLIASLKRDEGYRAEAYRDTEGVLTIGYGHNLEVEHWSEDRASTALWSDMRALEQAFATGHPSEHAVLERQLAGRQRALLNMLFNLGPSGLAGFRKMWAALNAGNYEQAAREMLDSKWAKQVGARATRLAAEMEA